MYLHRKRVELPLDLFGTPTWLLWCQVRNTPLTETISFPLKDTHNDNDAELARKLHENEKGLRARRQTARKPVVG